MAGGCIIYQSLSPLELEGWARISGTTPTGWELQQLRRMDLAYVSAKNSAGKDNYQHQGLGDYCQNKNVETCRAMFGNALESTCATCPN
jgi:hypothetical protein